MASAEIVVISYTVPENNILLVVFEEVWDISGVSWEPGCMKSNSLHGLGDVPLAAWQRVLCEELLNLRRKPWVSLQGYEEESLES